jgi:solute carrier family 50 protein (sugar transporter)
MKFTKRGSSDFMPMEMFLIGLLCSTLWLGYGVLKAESTIIQVNMIGAASNTIYLLIYIWYSSKKPNALSKLALVGAGTAALFMYISQLDSNAAIERLGLVSSAVNILAIGSPLIGLPDVIRTKSTESMPFPLIAVGFFCGVQWLLFGILIHDIYMVVPNAIGFVLGLFQLSLFVVYPSSAAKKRL